MIIIIQETAMKEVFDLETYLTEGVEKVVKGALRATLKDPKESLFMTKFALAEKSAAARRESEHDNGLHVPPFLIASITSKCNLHCAGCYSRANKACVDEPDAGRSAGNNLDDGQLTSEEWLRIFREARELGVSFILLAGGEPTLRMDIIEAAGGIPDIIFPVFTNGTLLGEKAFDLFDRCRNLVPVFSIEGRRDSTDQRRGEGIFDKLTMDMDEMKKRHLIFGASVTVTTENIKDVTSQEFLEGLARRGCRMVIFVEYVPVTEESARLAPGDEEREYLKTQMEDLREKFADDMIMISFPGDEKSSGGCLAAGRGFFHISSGGDAEPCPFSPYSDINVIETSLRDGLGSNLFRELGRRGLLMEDHAGGCVLYKRRAEVEKLV